MRVAFLVSSLAILATLAVGCGGLSSTEQANQQPYRVVLMVSDLEGQPLESAAVWIDSVLMEQRTAATFTPLGQGFPSEWSGWPANYVSPVLYTRIDFEGDVDHIEVLVARNGYRVGRTGFDLGDVSGTFFFRAAIPLEPAA